MNVLVTGAAGFIGGHFLDSIKKHANKVVALDKLSYAASLHNLSNIVKNYQFYAVGLEDNPQVIKIIVENNIDVVVNFAAETHVDNSIKDCRPFVKSNVDGVLSLLESCKFTKTKLVHVSTDEVYGPAVGCTFQEDDMLRPKNPYAATKAASEHLITSFGNTFGVNYIIVRPTNNYGPNQNVEKLIPKYISSLINDKKLPLYGAGDQIREWFFVKDCANTIANITANYDRMKHNVYNIGSPNTSMTNLEVCKLVHKAFNSNVSFEETISYVQDRPGHDVRYSIDTSRIKSELTNMTCTSLETGIKETIEFYRNEK